MRRLKATRISIDSHAAHACQLLSPLSRDRLELDLRSRYAANYRQDLPNDARETGRKREGRREGKETNKSNCAVEGILLVI